MSVSCVGVARCQLHIPAKCVFVHSFQEVPACPSTTDLSRCVLLEGLILWRCTANCSGVQNALETAMPCFVSSTYV